MPRQGYGLGVRCGHFVRVGQCRRRVTTRVTARAVCRLARAQEDGHLVRRGRAGDGVVRRELVCRQRHGHFVAARCRGVLRPPCSVWRRVCWLPLACLSVARVGVARVGMSRAREAGSPGTVFGRHPPHGRRAPRLHRVVRGGCVIKRVVDEEERGGRRARRVGRRRRGMAMAAAAAAAQRDSDNSNNKSPNRSAHSNGHDRHAGAVRRGRVRGERWCGRPGGVGCAGGS